MHCAGGILCCDQQFMNVIGCSVNLSAHGFVHVCDLNDWQIPLNLQTGSADNFVSYDGLSLILAQISLREWNVWKFFLGMFRVTQSMLHYSLRWIDVMLLSLSLPPPPEFIQVRLRFYVSVKTSIKSNDVVTFPHKINITHALGDCILLTLGKMEDTGDTGVVSQRECTVTTMRPLPPSRVVYIGQHNVGSLMSRKPIGLQDLLRG
jgi:hypothetical protein